MRNPPPALAEAYASGALKLILRIANIWPLFLALLILNTAWKIGWHYVAARSGGGGFAAKLAGSALYQSG